MTKKEYIERDKLYKFIEIFDAQYGDNIVFTKKELKHLIDIFPTADVAPVRYGEWIQRGRIIAYYECSECHYSIYQENHYNYSDNIMVFPKYCENCGAKMDGNEV